MYRRIRPDDERQLPLRMLLQPTGDGLFLRAAEADSFRGLVAAILDDPGYEAEDLERRLMHRLRIADDVVLLAEVSGEPKVSVSDRDGERTLNVSSDQRFIRSLDRLGYVSLDPRLLDGREVRD
jgi:hypothetical protein